VEELRKFFRKAKAEYSFIVERASAPARFSRLPLVRLGFD
jgi:hypothetical protein